MPTVLEFHVEGLADCTGMKVQLNVQTMRNIAQIFVAFSEKLIFTIFQLLIIE